MGSRRQSVSGVTQNIIMKKYTLIMFALMAVTACVLGSPQRKKISVKAPSPFENYGCQCDNYTWQDTYGKIQGNCKSSDTTRGRWCYVRSGNSCNDIQYSKNRRDSYGQLRQWSYEACATPAPSYGGGNGCRHGGGCGGSYGSGSNYASGSSYGSGSNYGSGANYGGGYNRPSRPYRPNRPSRPSYGR